LSSVIVRTDGVSPVSQTFRKQSKVKKGDITKVLIAVPSNLGRHCIARLRQKIADVLEAATGIVFDTVHILDLDELRQKVCQVMNGIRIMQLKLT
jgi:hypothetical protein